MIKFSKQINKQSGFMALTATLILTAVLMIIMFTNSTSSFFARFDALGSEFKRTSLGLSEACLNKALLKVTQDYNYELENEDGDVVVIEEDEYECIIESVTYEAVDDEDGNPIDMDIKKSVTIKTIAQYPLNNGSWSTNQAKAIVLNPAYSLPPPPTCSFIATDTTINLGQDVNLLWSIDGNADFFEIKRFTDMDNDGIVDSGEEEIIFSESGNISSSGTFIDDEDPDEYPEESATYTATVSGPGGDFVCEDPQQITIEPSLSCADTVMILDRSFSMFGYPDYPNGYENWIPDEKAAAKSLVDLYSQVPSHPKVGFGVFGDIASGVSAEIISHLTINYSAVKTAIDNSLPQYPISYTNLKDAIRVASDELTNNGDAEKKVLILVSDGDPNKPSGTTLSDTGLQSLTSNNQNGAGELWSNGIGAYTNGNGDASDPVSENDRHQFYNFNFGNGSGLPTGSTITGIQAVADAWATAGSSGVSTLLSDNFGTGSTDSTFDESPSWNENGSAEKRANGSGNDTASPNGGRFALVQNNSSICRTIDASGVTSLQMSYYWRGDIDANQNDDDGLVQYKIGGNCGDSSGWTTLQNYDLQIDNSWSTQNLFSLPSSLNNSSFLLRFRANSDNNEHFRVDNVLISGTSTPATSCQLGVDLSWNSGLNWTNEKTQTLTGTETTYTIPSSTNDDWTGTHTWSPTEFSNANFRARVRAIDPGSTCDNSAVDHLDWLQMKVYYTEPADPIESALDSADNAKLDDVEIFTIHFGEDPSGYAGKELLANLASGEDTVSSSGHNHNGSTHEDGSTYNSNNINDDTGYTSPTSQSFDSGGDGNGFEVNPTNAFTDVNSYASNINGPSDRHRYYGYDFDLPINANIVGIEARVDWWLDNTSGTNSMGVQLSWDGGNSWSSTVSQNTETTTDTNNKIIGNSSNTSVWGSHTWLLSDFNQNNFRVRLTSNCSGSSSSCNSRDFFLDWIPVKIYYSVDLENTDEDNFFIAPTSIDMQGIFTFIGQKVCPAAIPPEVTLDLCPSVPGVQISLDECIPPPPPPETLIDIGSWEEIISL